MVQWLACLLRTLIEYTLSCVIRVEVSFRWICILPKVVILAGMEYQSQSDLATVVITKPMHASETELCHWPPYSNWELSLKRQDALPLMTMGKQCGLDIETKIQTWLFSLMLILLSQMKKWQSSRSSWLFQYCQRKESPIKRLFFISIRSLLQ